MAVNYFRDLYSKDEAFIVVATRHFFPPVASVLMEEGIQDVSME